MRPQDQFLGRIELPSAPESPFEQVEFMRLHHFTDDSSLADPTQFGKNVIFQIKAAPRDK
ncbi:MAG: hypothetical protein JO089_08225 [Alphaproteobacteria bacterium]|nr:hypothetical protein [Alphaproteobacteria bacterium]